MACPLTASHEPQAKRDTDDCQRRSNLDDHVDAEREPDPADTQNEVAPPAPKLTQIGPLDV